jgi:ribonuclease P protein component
MINAVLRNTFRKPEKICNQNQIDALFKDGKSLKSGLFRLIFNETEKSGSSAVQVLIAVPKKSLRHAVDRNRMKRLIREAYRLNKHKINEVYIRNGKHCDLAVVFNGVKCVTQAETNIAINELLDRLIHTHEQNSK